MSTKLNMPAINKDSVLREKLLKKFADVPERKLTLVTAPAGYGKTTSTLQWLLQCGLQSAWVSLDSRDNSPGVFWRYVCSALDSIQNGIERDTEYVFSSQEMLRAGIQVDILIDKLKEAETDFILALDDLHYITDPDILRDISYLIDYMPPKMHLLVVSRAVPEIGLSRHKLKWDMRHITEDDLRFEEDEIMLFYKVRGISLDDAEISDISGRTEGWAAALVAVALSLKEGRKDGVFAALEESERDIGQYIKDEVLSFWNNEKRDFALKTCILDTLFPDICDAVTESQNGKRLLNELYNEGGFLSAVDLKRSEYRYHHLFKKLLTELLSDTFPCETAGLHRKAGIWFLGRDMLPEAMEHLLEGGLYGEALDIIENRLDSMIRKNDFSRLLRWVERLPEEYRKKSFKTAAIYALYYAQIGALDQAAEWLTKCKAVRQELADSKGEEWAKHSQAVCMLTEASILMLKGRPEFLKLFFMAENNARRMTGYTDFNMTDLYFYRSPVRILSKMFGQNPKQYDRMISGYRKTISDNPGYAHLAAGEYCYETNRPEEAVPYLLKALEEARKVGCLGVLVPAMVDLARIKRAKGDYGGALETAKECRLTLKNYGKTHWDYQLQAFICRLHIDTGAAGEVDEWLSSNKLNLFSDISRVREFELLVYCRALMFKGCTQDALLLLNRLLIFAEEASRLHSKTEILILSALAKQAENDIKGAADCLERALSAGSKENYVRTFLDEPALKGLLSYYAANTVRTAACPMADYAKFLLKEMPKDSLSRVNHTEAENLLTPKEKQVLELLLKAYSNREIALKLGISLITAKTHVGNIYSKLGVSSRAQCLSLFLNGDSPSSKED